MCSDSAQDTSSNDNPYVLSYITLSPANKLSISNVLVFFVHWALINIFISLSVAQASDLEYPGVQANRMTCYAVKLLILGKKCHIFHELLLTLGTLFAKKTFFLCGLPLAVITAAPEMEKKQK